MARQKAVPRYKKLWPNPKITPEGYRQREAMIGGVLRDVTPSPGNSYTKDTWPPRGRGRGESLTSPRRIEAKQRLNEALVLRFEQGLTWEEIATRLGYADATGPYRLVQRLLDRMDFEQQQREEQG